MKPEEKEVLNKLAEAFNMFSNLPIQHPMDIQEFCSKIHDLQRIVMAREAIRNDPSYFRTT